MLKPWQLGWSSSSGWRADVQRPGQTAPMHAQLSSPAQTPWVSPVSDVLYLLYLCRLSLWQMNCDSALFCPIRACHGVCDHLYDQHLGYENEPCFNLCYSMVILPLAEASECAGEEKPWCSAFWNESACGIWKQH